MPKMITLRDPGPQGVLAALPVSCEEFIAYLEAAGKPIPASLTRGGSRTAAVTAVSQGAAGDYCRWLSAKEGRPYRLPRLVELLELADEVTQEGISSEIWPHSHQPHPGLRGGMKPTYLCEWTEETDVIPQMGGVTAERILGSVFYPPWVRQSGNASHAQAHLAATEGYSFVTFRVAYDVV